MMTMRCAIIALAVVFVCGPAPADTVFLRNGGKVTGLIAQETEGTVEVRIGAGAVTIRKDGIRSIVRSSPDEARQLEAAWAAQDASLATVRAASDRARLARLAAYGKWAAEEASGGWPKAVTVKARGKCLIADAVLNGQIGVKLMVDTGASCITLSRSVGERLGVDLTDTTRDVVELQLVGRSKKTSAKLIRLDRIELGGVALDGLEAAVLFEESDGDGAQDGLLGMNFLSRFTVRFDARKMILLFDKPIAEGGDHEED